MNVYNQPTSRLTGTIPVHSCATKDLGLIDKSAVTCKQEDIEGR